MRYLVGLAILFCTFAASSQNVPTDRETKKFLLCINSRSTSLQKSITKKQNKLIAKLRREELKLYRIIKKKDTAFAETYLNSLEEFYSSTQKQYKDSSNFPKVEEYIPLLDTLRTAMNFLEGSELSGALKADLKSSGIALQVLNKNISLAKECTSLFERRKQELKIQLERLGLATKLRNINKCLYYQQAQLNEYKRILSDSKVAEQKVLSALRENTAFQQFLKRNSQLARIFNLPENYGSAESISNLQTQSAIASSLGQRGMNSNITPATLFQQVFPIQQELSKSKELLSSVRSDDLDKMDFKPNSQRVKSFFGRLEYGFNIQSQRSSSWMPTTSDVAVSLGYKLNDKSVIGVGTAYKLGLGQGLKDFQITSEGIGLRSYLDLKLKGNFWISGGYEQDFHNRFSSISVLKDVNAWQRSGLIGITRKIPLGKRKASRVQLLWNFLSRNNIPRSQPIIFRLGYDFSK